MREGKDKVQEMNEHNQWSGGQSLFIPVVPAVRSFPCNAHVKVNTSQETVCGIPQFNCNTHFFVLWKPISTSAE